MICMSGSCLDLIKCLYRSEPFGEKEAVALARLERAGNPSSGGDGVSDCDLEAMDSSDNEVWSL